MAVKAISGPMYVKLYASGSIPSGARLAKNTTPLITWLSAHYHRKGYPADKSRHALFAEQSRKSENGKRREVIKKYAPDRRRGSKPPPDDRADVISDFNVGVVIHAVYAETEQRIEIAPVSVKVGAFLKIILRETVP